MTVPLAESVLFFGDGVGIGVGVDVGTGVGVGVAEVVSAL